MKYLPRILLADDEVDYLTLVTAILRGNNFEVFSLSNGRDMFKVVKAFKPDIIILDVRLGRYDGKEICRQLKADEECKSIKVILHSAFPEIGNEYQLCGAAEFIVKPTNILHLISRLNFHMM